MKLIKVSDEVHRKLFEKKKESGKGSIGDVINDLLNLPKQRVLIKEAVSEAIEEGKHV